MKRMTTRPFACRMPTILLVLTLALLAALALGCRSNPASAANLGGPSAHIADPQPSAPKTLDNSAAEPTAPIQTATSRDAATYIYISCPIEIYRGTTYENEPAEYLVDDFEDLPEHWLYVLTPLETDENYLFTLDLSCRTISSPFQGEISAVYSSYVPDDGSLGSMRIEATEEIAPDTFLVYYGELKYISDGAIRLAQNDYANIYDHHLFYFSLSSLNAADLPDTAQPLSEQRISRLSDPAIQATVTITGDAERISSIYDEDLINSDYMYPYRKYDPAEGSRPAATTSLADRRSIMA